MLEWYPLVPRWKGGKLTARHSQEWQAAYDLSRNLAKECAELLVWEPVARFALESAIRSHRELRLAIDEEWLNLALAYLRVCAMRVDSEDEDEAAGELSEVLGHLRDSQMVFEGELIRLSIFAGN